MIKYVNLKQKGKDCLPQISNSNNDIINIAINNKDGGTDLSAICYMGGDTTWIVLSCYQGNVNKSGAGFDNVTEMNARCSANTATDVMIEMYMILNIQQ